MSWSISGSGTTLTSGFHNIRRTRVNQAPDVLTFDIAKNIDGDMPFALGATVTVTGPNGFKFLGRVTDLPGAATGSAESLQYKLEGPWWYLDHLVYQQPWKIPANELDSDSVLINANRSRVVLAQQLVTVGIPTVARINIEDQILAAINYAIDCGAPIAIGTISLPDIKPPYSEEVDITCGEVIRKMLRWAPDAAVWFDGANGDEINIAKRSSMSSQTIALAGLASLNIQPRPDLQVPSVYLKYERTHQLDEKTWVTVDVDSAGGSETDFGAVIQTIELEGSRQTYQTQSIKTELINENGVDWWKKHLPYLKDVSGLTIESGVKLEVETQDPTTKQRELLSGSCPPWMDPDTCIAAEVSALASYTWSDENAKVGYLVKKKKISVNITATNLTQNLYSQLQEFADAEAVPTGLAASLYAALSPLQWQGSILTVENEIAGTARPGKKLFISGGRSEWTTMTAVIQQVSEDIDSGQTTITFGPAEHLGPQDLIEILRANRGRRPIWRAPERNNAEPKGGGEVKGPKETSNANSSESTGRVEESSLSDSSGSKTITLAVASLAPAGNKEVKLREIERCDGKKAMVLMSDWY